MSLMKIEIIKNNDRFLALKQDWDQLFELGNYSSFQSFPLIIIHGILS